MDSKTRSKPTLDRCIGECMEPTINVNEMVLKNLRNWHQNCSTSQILMFNGYLEVRESLCMRHVIKFAITSVILMFGGSLKVRESL